ncbi:hypothetical protein, partial [Mesorhizobium sp.]
GRLEVNSGAFAQLCREEAMSKRSAIFISAFEFDVIRNAFWRSVVEDCLPREQWETRAGDLVRSFIGIEAPDEVLAALLDLTEKQGSPG